MRWIIPTIFALSAMTAGCSERPDSREKPVVIELRIDADGAALWNGTKGDDKQITELFRQAARTPKSDIELLPDRAAPYSEVVKVLSLAQTVGGLHLGFVGVDS